MNNGDCYKRLAMRLQEFNDLEDVISVLDIYLKLHTGKIGAHWLWCALERIARGEKECEVLWDYGYVYSDEIIEMKESTCE